MEFLRTPPKHYIILPPHYLSSSISSTSRRSSHSLSRTISMSMKISLPPKPNPLKLPNDSTSNNNTTNKISSLIDADDRKSVQFREKMLFLESIGIDFLSVIDHYPPAASVSSSSLEDIKSTVDFMYSSGFTPLDFRRICGMCPEVLNYKISDIAPVFTFLLREANVKDASHLRKVIHRRPRLLVCNVENQLRPTLYFLQRIGITDVHKHTYLLSCSVEDKFMPRIHYLEKVGFSYRDAVSMFRRFPQLFCYSIQYNFQPKFDYFAREMKRDLSELKEFPHYFSFSLDNRIKPRHLSCVAKGLHFPLPVMLKTHEALFRDRLEVPENTDCLRMKYKLEEEGLSSKEKKEKLVRPFCPHAITAQGHVCLIFLLRWCILRSLDIKHP